MTLDEIAALFSKALPTRDDVWYVEPVFRDRLFATRGSDGMFGVFLRGELEEFGRLPRSSALSHRTDVRIEPAGIVSPMLRVVAPHKTQGNRALVYLAFEACRLLDREPDLPNEELLQRLMWMLVLLEDDALVLSPERQRGLVGELQLLARLVRHAKARGRPGLVALEHWHGPWPAKRDFAAPGIAVEAKATSDDARIHAISSLSQLDPQDPEETVFVYSLGVRHDYSAPRRLKHFVGDVQVLLAETEIDDFNKRLTQYGFDTSRPEFYDTEPGISPFHLEPRFFAEAGLVRLRGDSFVAGRPPEPVVSISYRLLLTGQPVSLQGEAEVLDRLLR
jgi:hypothetical protein